MAGERKYLFEYPRMVKGRERMMVIDWMGLREILLLGLLVPVVCRALGELLQRRGRLCVGVLISLVKMRAVRFRLTPH